MAMARDNFSIRHALVALGNLIYATMDDSHIPGQAGTFLQEPLFSAQPQFTQLEERLCFV